MEIREVAKTEAFWVYSLDQKKAFGSLFFFEDVEKTFR